MKLQKTIFNNNSRDPLVMGAHAATLAFDVWATSPSRSRARSLAVTALERSSTSAAFAASASASRMLVSGASVCIFYFFHMT